MASKGGPIETWTETARKDFEYIRGPTIYGLWYMVEKEKASTGIRSWSLETFILIASNGVTELLENERPKSHLN